MIMTEPPELTNDVAGRSDFRNSTTIAVSFNQWNLLMTGAVPPTE